MTVLPDVNVLVGAFHRDATDHAAYAGWLSAQATAGGGLAIPDVVLTGMIRIVTHPRIFADPAPAAAAVAFVAALREAPGTSALAPTTAAWTTFEELVDGDRQLRGNLVPDAWLAALAIAHGCRLATSDRGFARFPGLDRVDPLR